MIKRYTLRELNKKSDYGASFFYSTTLLQEKDLRVNITFTSNNVSVFYKNEIKILMYISKVTVNYNQKVFRFKIPPKDKFLSQEFVLYSISIEINSLKNIANKILDAVLKQAV